MFSQMRLRKQELGAIAKKLKKGLRFINDWTPGMVCIERTRNKDKICFPI